MILAGCGSSGGNIIREIHIGTHHNNELQIQLDVVTAEPADVYAEYWSDSLGEGKKYTSFVSLGKGETNNQIVLSNILPKTNYSYRLIAKGKTHEQVSKVYTFQSNALPMWLQEQFKYSCDSLGYLPPVFKDGMMLVNKRETPGMVYLVDYLGRIRWYHMVDGTGYKVAHFTKDKTILAILGKNDEPTSYGSEILEISLQGDTVLHLKKGTGDFNQVIHHEIIKNNKGQLVTLFVDKRIMDLRAIGGQEKDTVNGDGILVMDDGGKRLWQWSVFDVMDPLKDPALLKTKKDWMHANSLNFDKDGNYIMSFYNNGQIWKVDAANGKVLWKFGKGGDIAMPEGCSFTQSHAVHFNPAGNLMFYNNGVEKRQSEVYAVKLDEAGKQAKLDLHIRLPKEVFNDRMGSAYMINDTTVLCCSSKRHIVVLTNRKGVLLWTLDTAVPAYRAEFISREQLQPYLQP